MTGQQLQHTHVLTHPGTAAVTFLQPFAEFVEHGRQLPVAVHVRVVQCGRPTLQCDQIVPWIEHLIARGITPLMSGDDCVLMHNLDVIHIALDRHRLERAGTRHAVTHIVEPRELILVDFRFLTHTGIERMLW